MAITRGAKKAHRASLRKREFNLVRKDKVSSLVVAGNKKEAEMMMRQAQKAIDKAVKGKTLKKNTASRKKAGLSRLVKKIS